MTREYPRSPIRGIGDIQLGESCELFIDIDESIVERFADLTGDYNPLHMDDSFAQTTPFNERVAHGMLTGSFVSALIGMHLPGPGALWLSQNYEFVSPVRIGDRIRLYGEIVRKSNSQGIIFLQVEAKNQVGSVVLKGEGKVKVFEEVKSMENKAINECRVLVTGASRGLGAMVALKFAEKGARTFLNYKSSHDKACEIQRQAEGFPGAIELVQGDVTTKEGIASIVEQINGEVIDIVILNAVSDFKQESFLGQSLEDFERALDYGVRCPVRLLQHLLPMMIEQKYGRIVSILSTSISGAPPAGFSSYNVNKKSLEAITKSIAVEYGKYNICANMVSPNMLRTDLTSHVPERMKQLLEAQTPLKRLANLEEIADCVVFLATASASYMNGHNLIISGGSTIL